MSLVQVDRRGNARWRRYKRRHGIMPLGFFRATAAMTVSGMGLRPDTLWEPAVMYHHGLTRKTAMHFNALRGIAR